MIDGHLDGADKAQLDVERRNSLIQATKLYDYSINLQPGVVRIVANSLLGGVEKLASFSFDGEQAGKIVFNERYNSSDFTVKYSLDGGNNWTQVILQHSETEQIIDLGERIKEITAEHGIQLQIVGSSEIYKIEITNGRTADSLIVNDLENLLLGDTSNLEYMLDNGETWCAYSDDTRFAGDVKVKVRYKQYGTSMLGPISKEYSFTSENEDNAENSIFR